LIEDAPAFETGCDPWSGPPEIHDLGNQIHEDPNDNNINNQSFSSPIIYNNCQMDAGGNQGCQFDGVFNSLQDGGGTATNRTERSNLRKGKDGHIGGEGGVGLQYSHRCHTIVIFPENRVLLMLNTNRMSQIMQHQSEIIGEGMIFIVLVICFGAGLALPNTSNIRNTMTIKEFKHIVRMFSNHGDRHFCGTLAKSNSFVIGIWGDATTHNFVVGSDTPLISDRELVLNHKLLA